MFGQWRHRLSEPPSSMVRRHAFQNYFPLSLMKMYTLLLHNASCIRASFSFIFSPIGPPPLKISVPVFCLFSV